MTIYVEGVKETIAELKRLDPEIRKTFNRNVRALTKPIIDNAKQRYDSQDFPSGTARNWEQGGRLKFPLTAARSKAQISSSIKTAKKNTSTILVIQKNPGAAIFEFANSGRLGAAFQVKNGLPARVVWPAADSSMPKVIDEMTDLIEKVSIQVGRRVR